MGDQQNPWQLVENWFQTQGWTPMPFQKETWSHILNNKSGLVNAPTGSGKTYALFIGIILEFIAKNPDYKTKSQNGLQVIWVSPIRALAKEIQMSCQRAVEALGVHWKVEIRTGDSSAKERQSQLKKPPEVLITTPESIHVLMATKGYPNFFKTLNIIVVDEWHELIGSKRGVQTELAISRLKGMIPPLKIWGISATLGNMDEAIEVLLYSVNASDRVLVKAEVKKDIQLRSVIPDVIEEFPWAGHLGLKMIDKVVDIIKNSKTSLIFTNTRAQCEIWYQKLLEYDPDLSGQIAMHHGSISKEIRDWVEEALYEGKILAVVCTSSLDLGVDFRPVDTIVQIGSPKGVSRFVQRAGRSGHQPGAKSQIYFVPTHALELIEAAGLRMAIDQGELEERIPYIRSFDVLVQYLMTLAVSDGFYADIILAEIKNTFCYASITDEEWRKVVSFLLMGSDSLQAYDEYKKLEKTDDGLYIVTDKKKILKHKLSIGTIVSDQMIQIKLLKGTRLGAIEEWFVSQLSPGDVFWFAGRALEFIRIKEMVAQVKLSKATSGKIPSYMGGRMPWSPQLSRVLQEKIYRYTEGIIEDIEISALKPIFDKQESRSLIPKRDEFLVEYFQSKEGYHLLMYPFEGRNVHEGMSALIAKRISMMMPISFSIAMNDFGFELLSDQAIDVDSVITKALFSTEHLASDIQSSINNVEMARRKFRDIAKISGLIFTGYPGKQKKERHLQASSQLIFDVFREYEPDNLLYLQTYEEVMTFQLEENRMRQCLKKIMASHIIISKPTKATPFSFPIIVDRLREKLTSEKLEDRIRKMTADLIK